MITFNKIINDIDSPGLGVHIDQSGILEFQQIDYHLLRPVGTGDYQIIYVMRGTGYFYFDGKLSIAPQGSVVLYAPNQRQEYGYSKEEGALIYFCHFSGRGIEALLCEYPIPTQQIFQGGTELPAYFSALSGEYAETGGTSAPILALLRLLQYASQQSSVQNQGTRDPIHSVLADIRENYMLDRSIEDYAALCHFSKYYFLRQFKARTGTTPILYRNEYRLAIAERLLLDSNLTVEAVAQSVGFSSATYFCRLYKKSRGHSPRGSKKD